MRKFFKRFFWVAVFLFFLNIGVSIYVLTYDLKARFPGIDFKRARFGVASWYSRTDKGINKHTANGEVFNDTRTTCASWDYPFGTRLLVVNTINHKWVVCRVNDRGPHKRLNRAVDLTKSAFKQIANPKRGLLYVAYLPVPKKK